MDIVKNIWDMNLSEDQEFFASLMLEEFGCNTRVEKIANPNFISQYVRPKNDFTIYTTAQPNAEGIRLISWNK